MPVTFSLKIKHFDKSVTSHKFKGKDGKQMSKIIGQKYLEDVVAVTANAVAETVALHNERVVYQAAVFFTRVVSRTPKDESYYDREKKVGHTADDDYVWKHWKIKYWGKEITAEQMDTTGELFGNENDFDNRMKIQEVANIIKSKLFKGEAKFSQRKSRIRNLRIENDHPRFAMLEYGTYEKKNSEIKKGDKHWHGLQNGYSVQAPYGMLRITQAEMLSMNESDFDRFISVFDRNSARVQKIPNKTQMMKLKKIMTENGIPKRHLSNKDIDAITEVYSV